MPEENICEEICSANNLERPQLQNLLGLVKSGDTIGVVRMDRFARSTLSAMNLIADLEKRGVCFKSLDIPECENPLFLEFFRTFILFFARWEKAIRRERQMAGIERAKGEKKYKGRKPKITAKLISHITERLYERNYKKSDIPRSLGISKQLITALFKKSENWKTRKFETN